VAAAHLRRAIVESEKIRDLFGAVMNRRGRKKKKRGGGGGVIDAGSIIGSVFRRDALSRGKPGWRQMGPAEGEKKRKKGGAFPSQLWSERLSGIPPSRRPG